MKSKISAKKVFTPLLFFFTFVLPVMVFYICYRIFSVKEVDSKEVKFGKSTFSVRIPGESLRIFDKNVLNPEKDKDFILTSWFKFRKLPADNEKAILITKYDAKTAYKQGYALAIEKKSSTGYRGSVFWQDINNNGRWYTFGEIPLVPGKWFMFTISYTSNEHLAFHYTYELDNEVITKLIGAYKVSALPASQSSFRAGSLVSQLFDGRIGTISIINAKDAENNLEEIINENFNSPRKISKYFNKNDIALWSVGGEPDLSKNQLVINKVGKIKKNKKGSKLTINKDLN